MRVEEFVHGMGSLLDIASTRISPLKDVEVPFRVLVRPAAGSAVSFSVILVY